MTRHYKGVTRLTPAEHEIITVLVAGETDRRAIANALGKSMRTVSAQLSDLYAKLDCVNLTALLYWALRNGWSIDVPEHTFVDDWIVDLEERLQSMIVELNRLSTARKKQ